jgi:DNA-binding CsgD family transcriptional regulator
VEDKILTPMAWYIEHPQAVRSKEKKEPSEREELSEREKEILVSVAKGMLNKEIADQYNISIHTVISHRKNITRKIGIKTVAGLTVYALLNGLIDINTVE